MVPYKLPAYAKSSSTVVINIEDTQDERKELRWTLTEWMRIKERMKMMDVWLAMNSDPKKDKFRPEIQFAYQMAQGDYDLRVGKNNVVDDFMKSDYLSVV